MCACVLLPRALPILIWGLILQNGCADMESGHVDIYFHVERTNLMTFKLEISLFWMKCWWEKKTCQFYKYFLINLFIFGGKRLSMISCVMRVSESVVLIF